LLTALPDAAAAGTANRRRHRRPPLPHLRSQVLLDNSIHSLSTVTPEGVPKQGHELLVSRESLRSAGSRPPHLSLYRTPHRRPLSTKG
jgi:hypothetical protein